MAVQLEEVICPTQKTIRTEQLTETISSQNILESRFSVETQKICGVGSGLAIRYYV
jgi:hypothetical protein